MPIMNFIGNIGYVVVCVVGGYFTATGAISVGRYTGVYVMRNFSQPIAQVAQISNVLQQTVSAAERVFGFLDETEEVPDTPDALGIYQRRRARGLLGMVALPLTM